MNLPQGVVGVAAIVFMFLVLVIPHEFGHFTVAKLFGVRVHEFALGLGTRIFGFHRGGTRYNLRVLPIAGYVQMAGMEPGEYDEPDGFHRKPALQRFLILLAGALCNFVVAALVMTGVLLVQVNSDPGKVQSVIGNSPAYTQGIRPDDSIRSVNGKPVKSETDILHEEQATHGSPLTLVVRRPNGSTFTAVVTPRLQSGQYRIGLSPAPVISRKDALVNGVTFPYHASVLVVTSIAQLVTGQIPGGFFGSNGATGVIGIGTLTYEVANQGLLDYLSLIAVLSVILGVTNILPLPALDGGRMVVVLLEKVRGRPFDRDRERAVQAAGLLALLSLMVVIAFLDVQRLATGQFPGMK
ncbi:MAG: site-2 protease family protein [Candidatus Dormibacteraeota bacterium]|nr:site-2 protease family protein [Candidatus Dormibacteraeota bacterium]